MNLPKITHVAIRFDGRIWSLPRPYRHNHIIRIIAYLSEEYGQYTKDNHTKVDAFGEDQGFLDENGKYLTRREAWANAEVNNQIIWEKSKVKGKLYSEDVW